MTIAKRSEPVTRRQFIAAAWALASVALVAQAATALYQFLKPIVAPGGFGTKVNVGNIKEFKVGTVSTVREMHGYVSRLDQKGAVVMAWKCTH